MEDAHAVAERAQCLVVEVARAWLVVVAGSFDRGLLTASKAYWSRLASRAPICRLSSLISDRPAPPARPAGVVAWDDGARTAAGPPSRL